MFKTSLSHGVVHKVPTDLRKALLSNEKIIEQWQSLTPLARNEWICWCITNKRPETRQNHINRTAEEMIKGKRRPCCWAGCPHRKK